MSGVFATAGAGDVRVWCLETCQELLRIVVPNFTCSAVLFSGDGKSIVTGTETLLPKMMSISVLVSPYHANTPELVLLTIEQEIQTVLTVYGPTPPSIHFHHNRRNIVSLLQT